MGELREEVEAVIGENGWTKLAIQKLRKVDSFLKESHRLNSNMSRTSFRPCYHTPCSLALPGLVVMTRKTRKTCTLSDGTLLPPGTFVGIAGEAMNKSEVRLHVVPLDAQHMQRLRKVFIPGCRNV